MSRVRPVNKKAKKTTKKNREKERDGGEGGSVRGVGRGERGNKADRWVERERGEYERGRERRERE